MKTRSNFANFGTATTKILVVARLQNPVVDPLPKGVLVRGRQEGRNVDGSFSAVSKPNLQINAK